MVGAHEIGALTAKPSLAGADAILRKGGEGRVLLVSLVLHFFCMLRPINILLAMSKFLTDHE